MRGVVSVLVAFMLGAVSASAQYQGMEPVRVSVDELVTAAGLYSDKPVIVRGKLDYGDMYDQNNNIFELQGDSALRSVRVGTSAYNSFEDLRFKAGREVEITGIFFDLDNVMMPERHPVLRYYPGAVRGQGQTLNVNANYFIAVTSAEVIEPLESELDPDKPEEQPDIVDPDIDVKDLSNVDLRALLKNPGPYVGKRVVVLGKFRGNNLYGDLNIRDKRTPRDFVIKVADSAIWVTGRRPRGEGFRLDPKKRRDTGKWLRVFGEPWEYEENLYFRAEKIELAEEPENPELEPVEALGEEDRELPPPPEIAFSLPLEGERGIALDTDFQVQFSNDMKRESFNRNVDLLYEDDDGISNPFPNLEVAYDDTTRTLIVRPHKELEPGKDIFLILYDAIQDEDGQAIVARPGASEVEPGAAIVLSFHTAT
jgi:hypothetical protein